MAREQDEAPGHQRLVAFVAVAGLTAATAFAFGRVFTGRAATLMLVGAAVASVGIGLLAERRGLVLALLASAAGLALALTWIVYPQTAWYGLPSIRTLRAVGRSLELVGQQARERVAPTGPLPPLMLAAVTAVWTASFSAHALVARAGSPLVAVLPCALLVGFADTVVGDGARPVYAVTFLAATLGVVFVDGLRRVHRWGPIWSASRGRRLSSVTSRGARRVALTAVLAAVLLPGLLPGFRSEALVDFSTGRAAGLRLDPFVSIKAQLEDDQPRELFEVRADGGSAYWRLYSLDRFDGTTWSSSDPEAEKGIVLSTPALLPNPIVPEAARLSQRYTILTDLKGPWLPMAYPAEAVTGPFGQIRYDPELGTAVVEGDLHEGLQYWVTSRIVSPTPEALDAVRFEAPARYGRFTFVPGNVDPRVGELARRWVRDQPTPYRRILALQQRFHDGSFLYTLDVEPVADGDALLEFLTTSRRGFCQQFATSMAIMARTLGYPARVAVGYRAGTREGDRFVVDTKDAHAWVEVFFPGYGWLPFEPTPGRSNPIAEPGSYLNPTAPVGCGAGEACPGGVGAGTTDGGGATDGGGLPPGVFRDEVIGTPRRGAGSEVPFLPTPSPASPIDRYRIPYGLLLRGLLALAVLLLVGVPVLKTTWRRRLLGRSKDPRELVLAAYRVFGSGVADLGLGRREGETLAEHRRRLASVSAPSDGHLARLTDATTRAAYSAEPPSRKEADAAARDARIAIRDLRRGAGWVRRIAGVYRPGL